MRFVPSADPFSFRMSRRDDLASLRQAHVAGAKYKKVGKKVKPVDLGSSDGSMPAGDPLWREKAIARERPKLDPTDKFAPWLYPKFSKLQKGTRLTPERLTKLRVGPNLTVNERLMLVEMLFNREAAIAWTFEEMGLVTEAVAPPQEIRTIEHTAWQCKGFNIPKALNQQVIEMLKDRIQKGVYEYCHGPYRNPWFLVEKSEPGKYRIVNANTELNKHTIRDANMPPSAEEFAEAVAGCQIASLVDLFSGYDEILLAEKDRDKTAFWTPLGLLRNTRLPQGSTNSVAQFQRIVYIILKAHMSSKALPYLDDFAVLGPKTRYDDETCTLQPRDGPSRTIRRYVKEHIQWLDGVLADCERAGITISGIKSQFCMDGLKVLGFLCDANGRHPDHDKVRKILDWPVPLDGTQIRAFLGICVYYRQWIEHLQRTQSLCTIY